MPVAKVTTNSFREQVLDSEVPVVVDFYADWCGPCHQIAPILNVLSQEHEGVVTFAKVNVDEEPELARAYRVSTIPAVMLFDSGVPTAWSIGPKPGYLLEKELGLTGLARRSKRDGGSGDNDDQEIQEGGVVASLKHWWRSQ